ncbi:aminodeoxychorismate synthase component I [Miniphocaeibacter halophilus]|uniref:aminodeoxychorismate synthase component I n=1 Tax=Miniphocaeibacter halophilus TaxID=2931922 RepID=UPI001FB2C4D9|nr:aminodeoxychorismate synthase component I [Miniphocaeibacter halophilus]
MQFHPESVATEYGYKIIENFNEITKKQSPYVKYKKYKSNIDDLTLFDTLHSLDKNIIWLDSSKIVKDDSRYSIFALSSKRGHILKYYSKDRRIEISGNINKTINQSIFDYMDDFLEKNKNDLNLPFSLGYVGYLGYELKGETLGSYNHNSNHPDAMFKFADRVVIKDHLTKELTLVYYSDDEFVLDNFIKKNIDFKNENLPSYYLEVEKKDYINDIKKCLKYIKEGESYEICLTNRLIIEESLEAIDYYKCLRAVSPSQYGALLLFDDFQICSSSMERFLKINSKNIVETKPIKGTLPRGKNKEEDEKLVQMLKNDERFHSENLMIVDLLRNDLGIICKKHSVKVTKLLDVETYKTLHQLVSTVEGELLDNSTIMDCIKATFPGGSMTGAPKKRTLEIIDRLEKSSRGIYSGAIGYFSLNKNVDLSIVIRTSVIEKDKTTIGVGGAIIDLSNPLEEYDEILLKASGSLNALKMYYSKK